MVTNSKLSGFIVFTTVLTFVLIVAGALVTSTGSGLSVPDWPLSFGQWFPEMTGGVVFEHSHRMIAGLVGLCTLVVVVGLWVTEERKWVRWLGMSALLTVVLQALLGGMTVLYGLPQPVSVFHAVLAQTFFCLMVVISVVTSPAWFDRTQSSQKIMEWFADKGTGSLAVKTSVLIYVQLIFGAILRHGYAMASLYLHLAGAALVLGSMTLLVYRFMFSSEPKVRIFGGILGGLLVVQLALGSTAALPMFGKGWFFLGVPRIAIVSLHVAIGALLLSATLSLSIFGARHRTET